MTSIKINPNCGNSPKMDFLKEINIAFIECNSKFLIESVTDAFIWNIIGGSNIEGKEQFRSALKDMENNLPKSVVIDKILTHGKDGAASGVIRMNSEKRYAFADFYEFSSAKGDKIKSMTTYMIKME